MWPQAFILEYKHGLRVIVHTANMIHCDCNSKSQVQKGPCLSYTIAHLSVDHIVLYAACANAAPLGTQGLWVQDFPRKVMSYR